MARTQNQLSSISAPLRRVAVPAVVACALAVSTSRAFAQDGVPKSQDVLTELTADEDRILAGGAPAKANSPAVASGDVAKLRAQVEELTRQLSAKGGPSAELKKLQQEKRNLELQREQLLNEVVKYKKVAEEQEVETEASPKTVRRMEKRFDLERKEITKELNQERKRAQELEYQIEQLQRDRDYSPDDRKAIKELETELAQERRHSRKLEEEIEETKRRAVGSVRKLEDQDELLEKVKEADQVAARLEEELESKRKIVADNNYLRSEVQRLTALAGRKAASVPQGGEAANGSATEVEALKKEREELRADVKKLISTYKTQLQELQQKNAANEEALAAKDREIDALKTQSKDADERAAKVAALEESVKTLQAEAQAAQQRADGATSHSAELSQELVKLHEQMSASNSDAEARAAAQKKTEDENKLLIDGLKRERGTTEELRATIAEQTKKVDELQARIEHLTSQTGADAAEVDKARAELAALKSSLPDRDKEVADLKEQLARRAADADAARLEADKVKQSAGAVPGLQDQITWLTKELNDTKGKLSDVSAKLADKEEIAASVPTLRRQLVEAKNQVLMLEQEAARKGGGQKVTARAASSVDTAPSPPPVRRPAAPAIVNTEAHDRLMEESGRRAGEDTLKGREREVSDVSIVEVKLPKVRMRSGPGAEHAEVMNVEQGTRLTVEAREGDWYRVITPKGTRAYVRSDVVRAVSGPLLSQRSSRTAAPTQGDLSPGLVAGDGGAPPRGPQKAVRRVPTLDSDMVPFGEVPEKTGGSMSREDRALEQLRKGIEKAGQTPEPLPQ